MLYSLDETSEAFLQQLKVVESDFGAITDLSAPSALPHWSIGALIGHITISLNLSKLSNASQPKKHQTQISFREWMRRTSEFSNEINLMTQGSAKKRSDLDITDQFLEGTQEARQFLEMVDDSAKIVLPAWDVWLSIEDFLLGRVVELTCHGIDLSRSIGRSTRPAPAAASLVAKLLDADLGSTRPDGLDDDVLWICASTGRDSHEDNRLPLFQ